MTKKEFALIAVGIKSAYPASKVLEDEASMRFWYQMLQDIDGKVFENAVMEHISTNIYPPNIAELRKLCMERCKTPVLSFDEAWGVVQNAISTYGWHNPEEAFATFDELTLSVIKNLGWTRLCMSENPTADRANFRDAYQQKAEETIHKNQLPEFVAQDKALLQKKYVPVLEKKIIQHIEHIEQKPHMEENREEYIKKFAELKGRLLSGKAE